MRYFKYTLTILLILFIFHLLFPALHLKALDEVEILQQQINELAHLKELSEAATTPLEKELTNIKTKVNNIKKELLAADTQTKHLAANIETRALQLDAQLQYLSKRVRSYYKLSRQNLPFITLLSAQSASGLTKQLTYRTTAVDQDKNIIINTTQDIIKLEKDKKELEIRQLKLTNLRTQFEANAAFFDTEITKAKAYQTQLAGKISELSRRQQEILSAKTGTFQTTVGDVPLADDPAARPDYNPGFSPAFAAFSFGAPHYKGMSQYGAFGRAKYGNQKVEEILTAYYGNVEIKKDYQTDLRLTVFNYGSVDLETYVHRIYEVPNSWGEDGGMEALKAQAVAARSYALAYTNNGQKPICATEACQVYKPTNKGGKWAEAVEATKGWVLVSGGQPFSAWYASTSGGYQMSYTAQGHTTPAFWDTPDGRSGWTARAWEKQANSPWFYKGWYKDRGGDSCGRSHPWLKGEELADIINAYTVLIKSGQSDERITPSGGCWGGNPYSIDELKNRSNSTGGGYTKVINLSVVYAENGVTANVTFDTDKGSITIPGADFKKAYNLRAPGKISIKSGLFNLEKK